MKNIKFKVLIMFMLLVLVGLGSSSVFATTQKVVDDYCKISDLYVIEGTPSRQKIFRLYLFDENGKKVTSDAEVILTNNNDGVVYTEFGELFKYLVEDYIIEKDGVQWIKKSEWVYFWEVYCSSIGVYGDFMEIYEPYLSSVTQKRDDIETIAKPTEPEKNPQDYEEDINNFWKKAFEWFKGAQASGGMGTVTDGFMKGATNIIKMIGNMIFIVVTSILGVKYIWGSADAKYSVKNSLFSLVIAAVVFYGWDSISNIIQTVTTSTVGNNIESTTKTIYTYILYFVNIAAIGGIIFLGVKYLLASAEGKSQLKMNMGPAFLGIIMVYATISFLNTILNIFLG